MDKEARTCMIGAQEGRLILLITAYSEEGGGERERGTERDSESEREREREPSLRYQPPAGGK